MTGKKPWKNNYFRFKDAIQQVNLKGSLKSVLRALNDHADEQGKLWPSYKTLARESGTSLSTAIRAIKDLEFLGLITVTRDETNSGDSDVNHYQLDLANIRLLAESQGCPYAGQVYMHNEEDHDGGKFCGMTPDEARKRGLNPDSLPEGSVMATEPSVTVTERLCHGDTRTTPLTPQALQETALHGGSTSTDVDAAPEVKITGGASESGRKLANLLNELTGRKAGGKVLSDWAERADGILAEHSESRIAEVVTWALTEGDGFWNTRILSMANLAKAFKTGGIQSQYDVCKNKSIKTQKPAKRKTAMSDNPSFKATDRDLSALAKGRL